MTICTSIWILQHKSRSTKEQARHVLGHTRQKDGFKNHLILFIRYTCKKYSCKRVMILLCYLLQHHFLQCSLKLLKRCSGNRLSIYLARIAGSNSKRALIMKFLFKRAFNAQYTSEIAFIWQKKYDI